jgi:HK97 family phage portal protein
MGIGSKWRALWGRGETREEDKAAADALSAALGRLLVSRGETPRRGSAELLKSFAESPWIRGVVGRISWEVASATRWELYDRPEGDRQRKQLPFNHPLLKLLRRPSSRLSPRLMWATAQSHIELCGEAFLMLDRNAAGVPVELTPAAPTWILETASDLRPYFRVANELYHRVVDVADMLWLKDLNPERPYGRGAGTAGALADEIDTDESAAKQTKAFFQNGGLPDALVSISGITADQAKTLKEDWVSKYAGPRKSHQAHFTGQAIDVKRLDTTFKDQDLVSLRKHERDTIVQVWGIPPEVFGILENSNRATVDAAYYLFARAVLVPRLRLITDELQRRLVPEFERAFPEYGEEIYLGFASPIPEDRDYFVRAVATAPAAFRAGEVRFSAGLQPDPEIDRNILGGGGVATPSQLPGAGAEDQEPGAPSAQSAEVAPPASEAPAAPPEVEIPLDENGEPVATDIQSMALNGAQIASLLAILDAVRAGNLPKESAIQALLISFPANLDSAAAHALVDPIQPAAPVPPPASAPPPAPEE